MADTIVFERSFPSVPSFSYMFMLEAMTFKVSIKPVVGLKPSQIEVQTWTNLYSKENCEGEWHAIYLDYLGQDDKKCCWDFGKSVIITSHGDFEFTYRVNSPFTDGWKWMSGYKVNGTIHVELPRESDNWTKGPNYDLIMGSVHLGNFIAATNAVICGFSHVLNVADNLDMVYKEGNIRYLKVSLKDGAANRIPKDKLLESVRWLQLYDDPTNKILVNCRAGIGRAGSIVLGYVFAAKEWLSYEEAFEYVSSKRFIYPHSGLKESLLQLFPRRPKFYY